MSLKKLVGKSIKTGLIAGSIFLASASFGQKHIPTRQDTINSPEKYYQKYDAFSVIDLERKILNRPKDTIVEYNLNKLIAVADSVFEKMNPGNVNELRDTYSLIQKAFLKEGVITDNVEDYLIEGLATSKTNPRIRLDCDLYSAIYKTINEKHNIKSKIQIMENHSFMKIKYEEKEFFWDATIGTPFTTKKEQAGITDKKGTINDPKEKAFYYVHAAASQDERLSKTYRKKLATLARRNNSEIGWMWYNEMRTYIVSNESKYDLIKAEYLLNESEKRNPKSNYFVWSNSESRKELNKLLKK